MRLPALAAGLLAILAAPLAGQAARDAGRPIVLGRDTVFTLHAPAPPYTLEQRALAVTAALQHAVERAAPGDSVHVAATPRGTILMLGETPLVAVQPGDAEAAGATPTVLAAQWAGALQAAIAGRGGPQDSRHVLQSVLRAVLATLAAVALAWLLVRMVRRLEDALRRWSEQHAGQLQLTKARLLSTEQLLHAFMVLGRAVRLAGLLAIAYGWLVAVLGAFAWTAPMAGRVLRYVTNPLLDMLRGAVGYLPSLIFIVVVIAALRLVVRALRLFFRAVENGSITLPDFPPEWGDPTFKLTRALVVAFGLILVFPYLPGAGSDAFKAISLFAGALFSLGSSGAVANIVAGSVITYTRAFKVGDFVRIGDSEGVVVERSLLVTRLRTGLNVDVSIPSATVLASHVQNFSAMASHSGLVVQGRVTIGYDAPWRTVHELLLQAARRTEGVRAEPPPFVLQEALNDYYPTYCVNVYTDRSTGLEVLRLRSRLHENIQDTFFEAGVEIMSPSFTALRDGNRTAMPARYLPPDYQAPGFTVTPASREEAARG